MRLSFIGKTAAKVSNVNVEAQKRGQTELVPASTIRLKVTQPNTILDQFDKRQQTPAQALAAALGQDEGAAAH